MVEIVFGHVGLDWRRYVKFDPNIVKRKTGTLFGDTSKLASVYRDWGHKKTFQEMLI